MKQILLSMVRIKVPDILDIMLIYLAIWLTIWAAAMYIFTTTSPEAKRIEREQKQYLEQLQKENDIPATRRAWKRLHLKHGHPGTIIYEPGKTPWYVDAQGRKCKFI